ncbi:hypothetical protein [Streptomyces sioyaensis]|uniref:hypothetical protein n=1 Tax=Streptomyces sioyaensis TaxID=67364 RepID=UPI0037BD3315
MTFHSSERLALQNTAALRDQQESERRCIRAHVAGGVPVDEICATWIDRHQDEIDRRACGVELPEALAASLQDRYGRTAAREAE